MRQKRLSIFLGAFAILMLVGAVAYGWWLFPIFAQQTRTDGGEVNLAAQEAGCPDFAVFRGMERQWLSQSHPRVNQIR